MAPTSVTGRVAAYQKRLASDSGSRLEKEAFIRQLSLGPGAAPVKKKDEKHHFPGFSPFDIPVEETGKTQKGNQMRRRLVNATLECLEAYGYHGTSLSKIMEMAGVTRGGWQYHYKTKQDLVVAAADAMFKYAGALAARHLVNLPKDSDNPVRDFFEMIWDRFHQGPFRNVWLEYMVASRTDRELNDRLVPVLESMWTDQIRLCSSYFQKVPHWKFPDASTMVRVLSLPLNLSRGLLIHSLHHHEPEVHRQIRFLLYDLLMALMEQYREEKPDLSDRS